MARSPQIPNAPWLRIKPPDWRNDRLKDVIPSILGGGTPSKSDPDCWNDGDIVWVTPTDFSRNSNRSEIVDSERKITQTGLESSAATLVPAKTVIMASRATIGAVRIAGKELATNQGFISFVCNDSVLHHRFLYYIISVSWATTSPRLLRARHSQKLVVAKQSWRQSRFPGERSNNASSRIWMQAAYQLTRRWPLNANNSKL